MMDGDGVERLAVSLAAEGQPPAVVISGDIDLANVAEFEDAITRALNGAATLTVDMTGVTYCDSAAVRALFGLAARTELTMVVRPSGHIKTLLGISGLDRVATVIARE